MIVLFSNLPLHVLAVSLTQFTLPLAASAQGKTKSRCCAFFSPRISVATASALPIFWHAMLGMMSSLATTISGCLCGSELVRQHGFTL